ncbi:MAG: hypothetical protein M1504_02305 [Candidatus Marsarchaeota archaeon]|nr:hypothetical protein [Candidatus Marsarchaeota archaeon]
MTDGIKKLSLGELVSRLYNSIKSLSGDIGKLVGRNREMSLVELAELRKQIKERLDKGIERTENERLIKLIDLFREDKNAIELIKIEMDEWLSFLDAMKDHLDDVRKGATDEELKEIGKMKSDITRLQNILRESK